MLAHPNSLLKNQMAFYSLAPELGIACGIAYG